MTEFRMPTLGADMSAGTLTAWRVAAGDRVERGDVVAIVETDKADVEVEVWTSGVVEELLVDPGTTVPVGTPLAILSGVTETAPPVFPEPVPGGAPPPSRPPPVRRPREEGQRLVISPSARELARELGVEPTTVEGSGPHGRITRKDVERAAAAAPASREERMRQAIAAAMTRSNREVPHFFLSQTIDMSRALDFLERTNAERPVAGRLLYGVLLLKAVARALADVPELNGFWRDGRAEPSEAVHVGVAISLRGGGLVAPALHDTARMDLDELMAAFRDLVRRARAGKLRSSELADPTITVTSLGEQGVEGVFGLIFPPQVAIVGFGKIAERPWVVEGGVEPRRLVTASLSADHRVVDGHRGGLYLAAVDRLLQEPEKL